MKKAGFSFVGCVLGMPLAAYLLPGIGYTELTTALVVGGLLGVVYLIVRPIARLILLPLGVITLGIAYVLADTLMLWFVVTRLSDMTIDTFWTAVIAAIIVNLVCAMMRGFAKK